MKAIQQTRYGSPDVLQLQDVAKPTPKDNEVLIKVHAASVNALDWHCVRGEPFFARFDMGFPNPKNTIPGADVAGVVETVGSSVTEFKQGDAVYGEVAAHGMGAFAEYVCAPAAAFVPKPANITFDQAAAVPVAAITALQGLRKGNIQAGQHVLINGASGGVGTFAVQIAKAFGAEVTAVCSTSKVEITRSIGADHVIDYTQEEVTQSGKQFDMVFDGVGNFTVADCARLVKPGGHCVVVGFTTLLRLLDVAVMGRWVQGKTVGLLGTAQPNQQDLLYLNDLLQDEKITPVIDRCYPLHETPQAIGYVEEGHAGGKVIINVVPA